MSLRTELSDELKRYAGTSSPTTLQAADSSGVQMAVECSAVDALSCAVSEVRVRVPSLPSPAFDAIKKWASSLSGRLTYLLENIGPLEFDKDAEQVLIRSAPPDKLPDGTQYYEMILSAGGADTMVLRRYRSVKGTAGRDPVEMTLTHEVLLKLADDLVATAPVP